MDSDRNRYMNKDTDKDRDTDRDMNIVVDMDPAKIYADRPDTPGKFVRGV
jgi:hypothetical protein